MQRILSDAAERAGRYIDNASDRRVPPTAGAIAALQQLGGDLPDGPTNDAEVIALLDEIGSPGTSTTTGPRYFGFVIGGSHPVSVAANWLAAAWDQNTGLEIISPAANRLEEIAGRWVVDLLGLPHESCVGFVTGATSANFTAICAARHALLKRAGWDVEQDGLYGAPPIKVVVGDEVHTSVLKGLALAGLGKRRVHRVPVDDQGRMIADLLPDLDDMTLVLTQGGNVDTGSFDPIGTVCARAAGTGAWVHVDGAFGLWAAASPSYAHLTKGIALADSWALDVHKWLNVPYDSGLMICRHPGFVRGGMSAAAPYLIEGAPREPYHYTPELSRKGRGAEVWATLRSLGKSGVADLIERNCSQAARFADKLGEAGFEILNDVVLNQVLVSFGTPDRTNEIISRIQQDGTCWVGGTLWQGRTAMRISVCNWSTTDADVDKSVASMINAAR